MARIDKKRLEFAVPVLNRVYNKEGIWFDMPDEEEDYGIDVESHRSGMTDGKAWRVDFKTELKTISPEYGKIFSKGSFYREKACRNRKWRYGLTADTRAAQEEIGRDTTKAPWWCGTDKPLHVLNAADKWGSEANSKVSHLREDKNNWVVFMYLGGFLVYTVEDLEDAIVGYAWQWLQHTKEHEDSSERWELKAVIDLDRPGDYIKKDIPLELVCARKKTGR